MYIIYIIIKIYSDYFSEYWTYLIVTVTLSLSLC